MICRKHSNDVAWQVETPGKSTILSCVKFTLSREKISMSHWRLRHSMTGKQVDAAMDAVSV